MLGFFKISIWDTRTLNQTFLYIKPLKWYFSIVFINYFENIHRLVLMLQTPQEGSFSNQDINLFQDIILGHESKGVVFFRKGQNKSVKWENA